MAGYQLDAYWTQPIDRLLATLDSAETGLRSADAASRRNKFGPNALTIGRRTTALHLFLGQFRSPLVLILIFAAAISAYVQEWADAVIVILIVLASAILGFVQEYRATTAVEKLRAQVKIKANVLRDGKARLLPTDEFVPGDVVLLSAGSLIPADGVVLQAKDFFVNQAVLTGETFPVEKVPGQATEMASLAARTNCVFMGTNVRSGTAHMLVVETGAATAYGQIAERLTLRPPENDFERGIRQFGYLLTQVMVLLVFFVFAANVFAARPPVDALLFAIALAVGIAPELLPAIVTLTLSQGAQHMAKHGVIVRRLNAIENLGSMDVLCTDKTGTLSQGVIRLDGALDVGGQPAAEVLQLAALNAHFQTGLANPLDEAITTAAQHQSITFEGIAKLDEIPYDFVRKRLSVVVSQADHPDEPATLITKGALETVLAVCTHVTYHAAPVPLTENERRLIRQRMESWSKLGFRVLGVATKAVEPKSLFRSDDECALSFGGYLIFFDPPKPGVEQTLADLARLGVQLKIITGDNHAVARYLAEAVGIKVTGVLSGADLNALHDEALWHKADNVNLFVEVDPNQKERIILALRKMGHVVGYMGDGINDAPALHAADVGISVDQAVDVAKEAADFVLLEHDLGVLIDGIAEGRKTFANTIKYIFTTTSANFGNMLSMAGASLFLPFLPLLAKQILLNNFLSDFPGMTIAGDNVDPEWVEQPYRWNMRFIRNFMIVFGLVSSIFDYLTFGVLLWWLQATPVQFRTGWFIESLLTELVIALVVRTRRPFFRSKPGRWLWISTVVVTVVTLAIPYLPGSEWLGFTPLPLSLMAVLVGLIGLYVVAVEVVKRVFYRTILAT